ncbi:MAG: M48 family metallopeptidase [Cephaloticoccus sp.]|nr:M48 family metallopeptidase [Cephaloticoccus sp.]MCF7759388.1 M48 family metallopeptidase [Cephaloticoccus sp.]
MSKHENISTPAGPAVLRRSDRKTLAISVQPDGELELIAPHDVPVGDIAAKVGKRLRWIVRQRAAFADMKRNRLTLRYESGATHTYLGRQYRLKVRCAKPVGVRLRGAYFHVCTNSGNPDEVQKLLEAWMRDKALEQFERRIARWESWCRHRRLPRPRVRVFNMRKRWGSAGAGGRIALNPDLVRAPSICIDYVIAHEICHLKYPLHNRAFFRLLDSVFPNWRNAKARLES